MLNPNALDHIELRVILGTHKVDLAHGSLSEYLDFLVVLIFALSDLRTFHDNIINRPGRSKHRTHSTIKCSEPLFI